MSDLSISGITGTDGKVPVYEPNGNWKQWAYFEIYLGAAGEGKWVPKLHDYVIDTDTDEKYIVTAIDPTTMVPTLSKVKTSNVSGVFDDVDVLLGVGPGTQSDTYRVFIDRSVMPHTLSVDARCFVNGADVVSCRIFKGTELGGAQLAISALYDQSGNLLGDAIPLELVANRFATNQAVKCVPTCYTTQELEDGEPVVAIFYSATGGVRSKRQLLVENTAFIRGANTGVKYVIDIALESPFLSQSDPSLLSYPMNVPISGLNLIGVVQYSDGTELRLPVDGTKFSVYGLKNYIATIVGQKAPFVLKYTLSTEETAVGTSVQSDRFISKSFAAQTVRRDGNYSVKLFGYPVWVDAVNGYRMEWYLYNLERNISYHATPYVRFNENTRSFDPLSYGVLQRLSVSVNLKDVNPSYNSFIHVQTIDITLLGAGSLRSTNWTVGFDPGQNPPYGQNNFAALTVVNTNLRKLKIDLGATTLAAWLQRIYFNTLPLVDSEVESVAPTPNFFAILVGANWLEYPIAQWNTEQIVSGVLTNNDTLFIKFFYRTTENDIQLGVSGIPVYLQS